MNQNGHRPTAASTRAHRTERPATAAAFGAVLLFASATCSVASPSDLCLTAARQASAETGVPLSVLVAITQVETGRRTEGRIQPWPWTINLEGEGSWFDNRQEALDFARQALSEGRTSFDTGCFQINYRWHSDQFNALDDMFDPLENARYAARFLMDLHAEKGDWSLAAGAYHSRNEIHASRYREQFDRLRDRAIEAGADQGVLLAQATAADLGNGGESVPAPRENTYPLLGGRSGGHTLGSLVPVSGGG